MSAGWNHFISLRMHVLFFAMTLGWGIESDHMGPWCLQRHRSCTQFGPV